MPQPRFRHLSLETPAEGAAGPGPDRPGRDLQPPGAARLEDPAPEDATSEDPTPEDSTSGTAATATPAPDDPAPDDSAAGGAAAGAPDGPAPGGPAPGQGACAPDKPAGPATPPAGTPPARETAPGGLGLGAARGRLVEAWRFLKAQSRDANLRLRPALAERRAALRGGAAARLRALAERRPERARALARALGARAPAAGAAAAILTARLDGWAAAAQRFAGLAPGAGAGLGALLLRRGAPGPGLDLIAPARRRPAALAPAEAARIVVYTTRFGPGALAPPALTACPGVRFIVLSDRDHPAEGWEPARFDPPAGIAPDLAPDFARIDPEAALARAAPEAEASLYLAPDILPAGNLDTLFARWLAPRDLAAWRHPRASGWQDLAEGAALAATGARRAAVLAQAQECEAAGLPQGAGAIDSRFLWRRHRAPAVRALAAAWWRAFARHPGDADLALARALQGPAPASAPASAPGAGPNAVPDSPPPGPRLLPAALGSSEDNIFAAALPARPAVPRRPPRASAGRPKIAIVHARGYEHYAATLLRGEQLAGLVAERLAESCDIVYTAEAGGLRDHVVVLTKWALGMRRPAEIASLRARNVAVIASWDDKIPEPGIVGVVDAQMSLSIRQTIELNRRFPRVPTFFVTHHVNRLIRAGEAPADRLRAGYFGEPINTLLPTSLAGRVELNAVATTRKSDAGWMDALDRYNCHWTVRRRHAFDGAKPFLKGFVAARCGAVVIVARDDGDAAYYLGDDYPFYAGGLDPATLEAAYLAAATAFGGPEWRLAQAIMRQVAARSADEVVCAQFRAMVEAVTA